MRFAKEVVLGTMLFSLSAAAALGVALLRPTLTLSPAEIAPRPGPRFWTGDIPAGAIVFCGDWAWNQSGYFCCVPTANRAPGAINGCGIVSGIAVPVLPPIANDVPANFLTSSRVERIVLGKGLAARRSTDHSVSTHVACGTLLHQEAPTMGAGAPSREAEGRNRRAVMRLSLSAIPAPANPLAGVSSAHHHRSNTMATPLPPERMLASLREVLADQQDLFAGTGSRTNTALASAAERESEQQLLQVMAALQLSPMYALAVEEFRLDLRRAGAADLSDSPDADSSLRLLCARLFLAGVSVEA